MSLGDTETDADGNFDVVSDTVNGNVIGIAAMMRKEGYYPTLTGVSAPYEDTNDYWPGNDIHDMWLVPEETVTRWSEMLAEEEFLSSYLPLGEEGGLIAFVRDDETGEPIAGAEVRSEDGEDSYAIIRYLNEEGTAFVDGATASSGIAIAFGAELEEGFEAWLGEDKIGDNVGASAAGTVLVLAIQ